MAGDVRLIWRQDLFSRADAVNTSGQYQIVQHRDIQACLRALWNIDHAPSRPTRTPVPEIAEQLFPAETDISPWRYMQPIFQHIVSVTSERHIALSFEVLTSVSAAAYYLSVNKFGDLLHGAEFELAKRGDSWLANFRLHQVGRFRRRLAKLGQYWTSSDKISTWAVNCKDAEFSATWEDLPVGDREGEALALETTPQKNLSA
ncbi:hypothetical protein GLOTRDRAFT_96993 [Gloeophyllum trabeum ATCC 11539]|uniref:Uncharacterized protein n=1 Tax=Gloeophyllum trabeum (strain ATCC 11539 / FP-39264 / Madison 617) TaxID=670483 RepID=S7PRU3_GLOTA|nr:uncharacterized protein GLOTRDRAFT_96993 [Gloeophyllum trabeum ATCC 11539]EPQ50521.1 hypothetical protein GLOTRDRAFT_96993 [Gloeophyllum trabeum ATCC 11539]